MEMIQNYDLDVIGFRHGDSSYSGGYKLQSNENIDDAIQTYEREHQFMLKQDLKSLRSMMKSSKGDRDIQQAIYARMKAVEQRQIDFTTYGMRLIGLEVKGQPVEMMRLWKNAPEQGSSY